MFDVHGWEVRVSLALTMPFGAAQPVATGRCAVQTSRSPAMSHPASAVSPKSTSSCTPDPRTSRTTSWTLPVWSLAWVLTARQTQEPILADDVRVFASLSTAVSGHNPPLEQLLGHNSPFFLPARLHVLYFYARKQLLLSALLGHRNSVRPSVCHTGGSVKSDAS